MLMLRAPMTLNDLKARTERMVDFDSIEDIKLWIDKMTERSDPLIILIPKGSGQREDRYTHLLCGQPFGDIINTSSTAAIKPEVVHENTLDYEQQIRELQARVARLEEALGIDEGSSINQLD